MFVKLIPQCNSGIVKSVVSSRFFYYCTNQRIGYKEYKAGNHVLRRNILLKS